MHLERPARGSLMQAYTNCVSDHRADNLSGLEDVAEACKDEYSGETLPQSVIPQPKRVSSTAARLCSRNSEILNECLLTTKSIAVLGDVATRLISIDSKNWPVIFSKWAGKFELCGYFRRAL